MRSWFDQGYESFSRAFPDVARNVNDQPFYVCPLCLFAGSVKALEQGWLSREDVPPKALGGRKIVLTCKRCNDRGGHELDCHARREADVYAFFAHEKTGTRGRLRTSAGSVPIQVRVTDGGPIQMLCVPKAAPKSESNAVQHDFSKATQPDGWRDFTFNIDFPSFSQPKAGTSWLRSAYLAWFATLGYRFIFRPELDVVRERIKNPESLEPATFRIVQPKPVAEPTLVRIEEPTAFRSFAMLFGRNVIFLPRYGDRNLFARLNRQPDCSVDFKGTAYPWPDRPLFFHDFLPLK